MQKAEWIRLATRRRNAIQEIAEALGKYHAITTMMGSMAWGRHDWEGNPGTIQGAIRQASALEGAFWVLNIWARDNDSVAQSKMLDIWYQEVKP